MSTPSDVISARDLMDVLRRARAEGTLEALISSVMSESADSEFELLPGGETMAPSGESMTDASKRRMVTPPEKEVVMAGSSDDRTKTTASPHSFGMKLPAGINHVEMWGQTLIQVGKFGKDELTYEDLASSTKGVHSSYVSWLLTQKFRLDLTPPMKDLIRFLIVRTKMMHPEEECFEGSTVRRQLKKS